MNKKNCDFTEETINIVPKKKKTKKKKTEIPVKDECSSSVNVTPKKKKIETNSIQEGNKKETEHDSQVDELIKKIDGLNVKDFLKFTEEFKELKKKKNKPYYGYFRCHHCKKGWKSGNSWIDSYQNCKTCERKIYAYKLEFRKPNDSDRKNDKHHPEEFCEKCKELGHYCRNNVDSDSDQ